ncbi:MAG: glucarate dehydratase [Candidatus Eremiobacteraeota bacterium]|nr:glucarate dehydratase [Candidatus Eremiobacteraeota bacterium]
MTVTPVAIADPPLRSSYGLHAPYALRAIVELRSEDGVVGISETRGGDKMLADLERVRDVVVGSDARGLTHLQERVTAAHAATARNTVPGERTNPRDVPLRVYGALEVAALDLVARAEGVPFCDLLGGRVRDTVAFCGYLFYKHAGGGGEGDDAREDVYGEALTPGAIVAQARALRARYGFASLKLKAGVLDPEVEADAMLALRDAFGPGVPLRIDPNCAWTHDTALRVVERLHGVVEIVEDPVSGIGGMGALVAAMRERGIAIPLASNVAVTWFDDIPPAVACDAVQMILGDHHFWGGPRAITDLGRLCETFDLQLAMHSNSHLGVSLMAMVHVAAATPQLRYVCDTHYPWQDARDEIVEGGRVAIVDGAVAVPTAPGLGVTLDRDALARGRERYERQPYRKRDDTAEMRKHVDPAWTRTVPAW